MHIEVDKKAHRDRQTDRQTREHAEAYKTRRKGSQGRTQRQIKVKRALIHGCPEIGEVSSRGLIIYRTRYW